MTISKRTKAAAAAREAHIAIANARAAALVPTIKALQGSGVTSMRGIAMALNARNRAQSVASNAGSAIAGAVGVACPPGAASPMRPPG